MQIENVIEIVIIINTRIVHLKDLVIFLEDDLYPILKISDLIQNKAQGTSSMQGGRH